MGHPAFDARSLRRIARALLPLALVTSLVGGCPATRLAAQAAVEDRYIDNDGVRLRYVDVGRGDPVVLIHSMSDSLELWRDRGIIDRLAADFRVIAFDSRGHGRSGKPHDSAQYGVAMVNEVARLLDHLRLPRAHVVGYSMGGYVAAKLAAMYPERALTVTFGGSSIMSPAVWAARFDGRIGPIADSLERGDPRPLLARQATGEELERRVADLVARSDLRALAAAVRSFGAMTVTRAEMTKLRMPLLVIVGSEDLPDSRIAAFAGLEPRPTVALIEGATHGGVTGTLRHPEFIRALRAFLDAHPAQ